MTRVKLAIDAGHGMGNRSAGVYDSGATAAGVTEASIVLFVALTVGYVMKQVSIPVWYTRTNGADPDPVSSRAARAAAAGCTHFLSLHCNCADGRATGTETFYRDAFDQPFAAACQLSALDAFGLRDRGLKLESESQHTRLAVLGFGPPACLVELGFIDNPIDRAAMLDRENRIQFAYSVRDNLLAL